MHCKSLLCKQTSNRKPGGKKIMEYRKFNIISSKTSKINNMKSNKIRKSLPRRKSPPPFMCRKLVFTNAFGISFIIIIFYLAFYCWRSQRSAHIHTNSHLILSSWSSLCAIVFANVIRVHSQDSRKSKCYRFATSFSSSSSRCRWFLPFDFIPPLFYCAQS